MFPVECVARGYLSGSGWKEYKATGTVCGIKLPAGLKESDQLPEPIFTPATKATTGHDINISFEEPCKPQDSYDKQYVRDYLEEIRWNKQPPAPALPQDVALRTSEKYLGAYRQLTGRELEI